MAVIRPDVSTGMANPQVCPILSDHLGTPRKVLDGATGQTRWSWDAKQPFGHEMPLETPTAGLPAFTFDLRFPGQRFDEETGLFHNGFRDYHPGLGRYVQSDPLGLEAGWNTYSYVSNSPGVFLDPLGLFLQIYHSETKENREKIEQALSILEKSPSAKKMIDELKNSKSVYTIRIGKSAYKDRSVTWNPNVGSQCISGGYSTSVVLLAHELFHAIEDERKLIVKGRDMNHIEGNAVFIENMVSRELGFGNGRQYYKLSIPKKEE